MVQKINEMIKDILEPLVKKVKLILDLILFCVFVACISFFVITYNKYESVSKTNILDTKFRGITAKGDTIYYIPKYDIYYVKQIIK